MVKSPGPKRAMSSSSLAGLRGNEESEREGDPSGRGEERTVGLEISEADEEAARLVGGLVLGETCLTGADTTAAVAADKR
jgi:hypothetical protein